MAGFGVFYCWKGQELAEKVQMRHSQCWPSLENGWRLLWEYSRSIHSTHPMAKMVGPDCSSGKVWAFPGTFPGKPDLGVAQDYQPDKPPRPAQPDCVIAPTVSICKKQYQTPKYL